jgi:membrane protein
VDRQQLERTLTFWLRPDFVLRVLNRFDKIAGFDRAIALASSAFTATVPLIVALGVAARQLGGKDTAERIVDRYGLTGGGADAVREIFSAPAGVDTSLGVAGALFLLLAVLSFSRTVQRLFEQTWELPPMSVRNTLNGLRWAVGLALLMAIGVALQALLGRGRLGLVATLTLTPIVAAFLVWSGWVLSARRIAWRDLVPFGVLGAGLGALYALGTGLYLPHLFSTYATRYGVIGAVFAMISAFFCLMVVVVASAAAGREMHEELTRIRLGRRPAEDEVRRQWDELIAGVRSRWRSAAATARRRRVRPRAKS